MTAKPQTVVNYASHLAAIFAIALPLWGYRIDKQEIKDAVKVANRMGIISRSAQRDRRPTLDELDHLIGHFIERRFTQVCKLLDIDDLRFHDLRHEDISRLFEMGWNIRHAAAGSGHRS